MQGTITYLGDCLGFSILQAQTQASPVQGERVTWSDELNM